MLFWRFITGCLLRRKRRSLRTSQLLPKSPPKGLFYIEMAKTITQQEALMKVAQRCRYDLFYLCKYILGGDGLEEAVHGELCRYVETLLPNHRPDWQPPEEKDGKHLEDQFHYNNKNLLLLMPRGTFKSSTVTVGFTLQYLLNEPNARILIDSETHVKAKMFLAEIKGHLETTEAYREVFRAIHGVYPNGMGIGQKKRSDLLWTNNEVVLASRTRPLKEPSVMVSGIDKTVNGMHFDLIIMDDLHSEKNVTNKEQINQVIQHWQLAYSLLDPGQPLIVIGTRWHFADLYQEILDKHRGEYNILIKRAILKDGTAFFPQRLPLEELEKIRNKQGVAHFSRQYLNEPVSEEDATFKRSDIVRREWGMVAARPTNWYLMVDPSFEGPYSDFAALVVAGMDYQRDIYVRHVLRKKMTYSMIIQSIFDLNHRYKPKTVVIKVVGTAKSLMYELNNEMKRRGVWLPIKEVRDSMHSKEERIRGLAPFYEFGHAFHIADCPQLLDLEDEMLKFPLAEHDDILDAYASLLEVATPPNAKSSSGYHYGDEPKRDLSYKPRSMITKV